MRRAGGLAGGRAAFHDVAAVGAVLHVVAASIPWDSPVGVVCVGYVRVSRAVLLPKAERVRLAVFNALAAGDALFLIHTRSKVGADSIL